MPKVVTQTVSIKNAISETLTFGLATSVNVPANVDATYVYANGTTAAAIDDRIEKVYTLAAGGTQTITLSAMTDDLGRAVAFARIKVLQVSITAKTGNDYLTVGNAATNPWLAILGGTTPTFIVRGCDLKTANDATGFVVVSGSSDRLMFTNSGAAPVTFTVALTDCSA
jgi:hypothetical protein